MNRHVRCALFLGALTAAQAPVWAESHEQTRDGFWRGFAIGYGSADTSATTLLGATEVEGGERQKALSSTLRLGGTIGERTLLGCEINAWSETEAGSTRILGNVSAAIYFYPVRRSGFFVKGGAGFGMLVDDIKNDDEDVSGLGVGLLAGVGYDYRIGRDLSLTPTATFYAGWPDKLKYGGEVLGTGVKYNVLEVGLGLTFH